MGTEVLTVVFRHERPTIDAIIAGVQRALAGESAPQLAQTLGRLRNRTRRPFNIKRPELEIQLASVGSWQLDFLAVKLVDPTALVWDRWADVFVADPDAVMAWVADADYEHWQNAQDPLEYTAVGKSYAHLAMVRPALPPPLDQMVIDTSANPGRRALRDGYIEVVGSVMWLTEAFWRLTGANRQHVAATPWLAVSAPSPSVTRLQADERCFTTAEGASGERQLELRALLFPMAS